MKKRTGLGLLGLALAGGTAAGMSALRRQLHHRAMTAIPRNPRYDEVEPRIHREGREWARRGAGFRTMTIRSTDGLTLSAKAIPASGECHRWAICVHGYADTHTGMGAYALRYHREGWNVLMPDQRGYGDSEGTYMGWGYLERLDLVGWISLLLRRDPQAEILLHGVSMGAVTVLMTIGGPLPKQVKCAVSDCAFTSMEEELHHVLTRRRSTTGKGVELPAGLAIPMLRRAVLHRDGFDIRDASALKAVEQSTTPTLFIHGGQDLLVPPVMMERLYEAAACPKSRLWVPQAEHATALGTDPVRYWAAVDRFLRRYFK